VHDLAYLHYPSHINFSALKFYRHFVPRYVNKATRIATVSDFSRNDIHRAFHYPLDKIDVTYNGAHEFFQPLAETEKLKIISRYTQGAPYFVYAGAIQPRKNVTTLFKAFDRLKTDYKIPHKLIIAGRFAWKSKEVKSCYDALNHKEDIVFTGHLGRNELARIMGAAYALVYISLFEGFGIPIVEAAQCGVPCITSNSSSMPEVCGRAGLLIQEPQNVQEVADAMWRIIHDKQLYHDLCTNAPLQAAKFNWDNTAFKLWQCVLKALA
jgi:glycosyltransferase involved in cell wall biosynthesis